MNEPSPIDDVRMGVWATLSNVAKVLLRFLWIWPWDCRILFLSRKVTERPRQRAPADLKERGCDETFVSDGDILVAWLVQLTAPLHPRAGLV